MMVEYLGTLAQIVMGVTVAGFVVYALILLAYAFSAKWAVKLLSTGKPAYMFGLPISGAIAFGIVSILYEVAPSGHDEKGRLLLKAFGTEFSGPAGPVTLWVVCYLALVISMRLVQPKK